MDSLKAAMQISSSGLKAQSTRLRVIAENVANADSMPSEPGQDPYRRKVVTFKNIMDHQAGISKVEVAKVQEDQTDFEMRYQPSHPAADGQGYIKVPNVNPLIEMVDMQQAQRSYQANVNVIESSRQMLQRTIGLLKSGQ